MKRLSLLLLWIVAFCSLASGQVASGSLKQPRTINVTAPTQAAIRAAITRAKNTTGPDIIMLPDAGTSGITLTSPLPVIAGGDAISYRGVRPLMTHSGHVPDNDFTFVGGTWFKGDGTFPCFQQQNSAGTALDQDTTVGVNFSTTGARQFEISNIGIQNFSRGFSIGAQNQCGALYSTIHDIWIKSCTDWAVRLANFQHCDIYRIWSYSNIYGFRFYADVARGTLAPGNSRIGEIFDNPGSALTANQLRKHRGLVFEATAGSNLNEISADRIQANFFSRSATTTFTSQVGGPYAGFVRVAAGTGANLQVGMPVKFGNTGGNGNVNTTQCYYVKTISTDDVTVADSRTGAAITGNFTSSATLITYGFGNMEVIAGSGGNVTNCNYSNIDLEGQCQNALDLENATGNTFVLNEVFANPSAEQHIVVRLSQPNYLIVTNQFTTDVDGSSTNCVFIGSRDVSNSRQNTGQWWGKSSTADSNGAQAFAIGSSDVSVRGWDLMFRTPSGGQYIQPYIPLGIRVNGDRGGGAWGLNPGTAGLGRYTGSGATATLPTLSSDDTTNAKTANIGVHFLWYNNGTGNLTFATASGQPFNGVSTLESIVVPPPVSGQVSWIEVWGAQNNANGTSSSTFYWAARWGGLVFKNSGNLAFASDANKTLTATEAMFDNIVLAGGSTLTATRNVVVPLAPGKVWSVTNSTTGAQSIQVIGASGTGVTIANARTAMVRSDGTNIVRMTADSVLN